jgi:hypothetical protein
MAVLPVIATRRPAWPSKGRFKAEKEPAFQELVPADGILAAVKNGTSARPAGSSRINAINHTRSVRLSEGAEIIA